MPDGLTQEMKVDRFRVDGGCWCPGERTLHQLRVGGHTQECTAARRGWEANARHMSQIALRRREDENAGRQFRESAAALLGDE